jgi:hypothetical protein
VVVQVRACCGGRREALVETRQAGGFTWSRAAGLGDGEPPGLDVRLRFEQDEEETAPKLDA